MGWVESEDGAEEIYSSRGMETPFASIESSYEYLTLLVNEIQEADLEIKSEMAIAASEAAERRKRALQLVSYNLAELATHITTSRRILNDLRRLRRLLPRNL